MKSSLSFIFALCFMNYWLVSCQSSDKSRENIAEVNPGLAETNPPAEGFDQAGSDTTAIRIANEVMQAMGGRAAWDSTRYLAWNFFGNRSLLWDKQTGKVRIEVPQDSAIYMINVQEDTGRVMMKGQEITNPDSLAKYVEQGKKIWVNDSYWLFMPFKLKDSGVTLHYVGEDTMQGGEKADVLELRFKNVGFTPENKYRVYVDQNDHLVKQWAYYPQASMDTPRFISPWEDYKKYGNILLAGDRGDRDITDIKVMEDVPDTMFTSTEFQM